MVSKHDARTAIALSESWPGPMLSRAKAAREIWLSEHGVIGEPPIDACSTLMLGTDCAGAEAPVFALKGLKLPFQHQWAAEIAPHARAFITSTCALSPDRLLGDMCSRRHQDLDTISLYVCGFPCKPWSRLNNHSRHWDDPNAKPFEAGPTISFAMLETVQAKRPSICIFENVVGILPFMPEIQGRMPAALPEYHIFWTRQCPTSLGHAVRRPRIYFLAIRKDASVIEDAAGLCCLGNCLLGSLRKDLVAPLGDRLLPKTHRFVKRFLDQQCQKSESKGQEKNKPKWKSQQVRERQLLTSEQRQCPGPPKIDGHLTARQRGAWELEWRRQCHANESLAVDVSQTAGRCPFGVGGLCPTLTPGGKVVVASVKRCICPEEAMLLHGFPFNAIQASSVSPKQLASLAGNAMHVESVAAMLVVGLSLLRVNRINASPPAVPWSTSVSAFLQMKAHGVDADEGVAVKKVAKQVPSVKEQIDKGAAKRPAKMIAVKKIATAKPKASAKQQYPHRKLSGHYGKPSVFEKASVKPKKSRRS
ncbi:unnamed protein product [Symbiodinium sp. CCMP2592]|nr:unnamed protein product [Symbiodinium sp. CCMP2592]